MNSILEGFELRELLHESEHTIVWRARQQRNDQTRILKLLKSDCPRSEDLVAYKREYEITSRLDRKHVIRGFQFEVVRNKPVLVLEDIGGTSLDQSIVTAGRPLTERLELAIQIADGIAEIHCEGIIHKNINPSNLVFNANTSRLKIIDFGIAAILTRERPLRKGPGVLDGTLAYVSPEQTGRMNRTLDCRSDLYSFGVTLYELFTGKLPFSGDALALVHRHLTQPAVSVHELVPTIPLPLSNIVAKLMAKAPEDRYQSAWRIKADLEQCLTQLRAYDRIEPFELGRRDVPQHFHLSPKLYGRDDELAELLGAFDHVSNGGRELVLVAGYSGIGKTSLVQEIFKPLTQRRGYFITGKFDQLQRNVPYSAFAKALQDLVRQLLTESDETLRCWRDKLSVALGQSGQLVVDMIPEVELIIGPQPPLPELSPPEAHNRFNQVFQSFIRAFRTPEHPLVIFLDDLQWADRATLKLLEVLMTDEGTRQLLVIGAYRDNEVSEDHPLLAMLEGLAKQGAPVRKILLSPLCLGQLTELVADTLYSDVQAATPLAMLVQAKTGGNPFFVGQFLDALYEEGLIRFSATVDGVADRPRWCWDLDRIEQSRITDNVVDLMAQKLRKLPPQTVKVLQLAACLGNRFDVPALAVIDKRRIGETYADLFPAIQEGMLLPTTDLEFLEPENVDGPLGFLHCGFLHDRVQQAAYALIEDASKPRLHLEIGRRLLASTDESTRPPRIFELVDHLNLGRRLISSPGERIELARLDLEAARKAKLATAYGAALRYLEHGMATFEGDWDNHYALTRALFRERAEVEYLNGNHTRSEGLIDEIWARAVPLDRAEAYAQLVTQHTLLGNNEAAITAAAKALSLVGIDFPSEDELQAELDVELARFDRALDGRPVASLVDLPSMTDPRIMVAMKLLMTVHTATFFSNRFLLYSWVLARMTNLSMEYGNAPESAKGYASFGNTLAAHRSRYELGFEFGELGLSLARKYDDNSLRCKACLILSMFLNHWVQPIAMAEAFDEEGERTGMDEGELQFVGYLLFYGRTANRFHRGEPLDQLLTEVRKHLAFTRKVKHSLSTDSLLGALLVMSNLVGSTRAPCSFDLEELSEADYLRACGEDRSFAALAFYETNKAFALYLLGDAEAALLSIEKAKPLLGYIKGVLTEAEHCFYHSLILAALSSNVRIRSHPVPDRQRSAYREELNANLDHLRSWAEHCPANFLHASLLVAAEMARLDGDGAQAASLYDRAIAAARDNGFRQDQALASELAGRFWLSRGNEDSALVYLRNALDSYGAWGAKRKQSILLRTYPELSARPRAGSQPENGGRLASDGSPSLVPRDSSALFTDRTLITTLDLASVLKACQVISSETDLGPLLDRLLRVVIESAGARRGVVMLARDGRLRIAASITAGPEQATLLTDTPVESSMEVPHLVAQYVARTHAGVVLRDASREGMFTADPYVRTRGARSVLCLPVLQGGKLTGVLYLENDQIAGAFSADRVELLEILAAQAAIALQNASLLSMERAARAAAEEAEHRTAFFAETTRLLTESLEYEEVLSRLANLVVSNFADWCIIDVVDGTRVQRLVGKHADPAKQHLVDELQRYPCSLASPRPDGRALRTGEAVLFGDVSEEAVRAVAGDEGPVQLILQLGTRSVLAVPLAVRGRSLGMVTLGSSEEGRRYGPTDVELAQEIANRAAIAIENAQLFEQTQKAVQVRDEFLMVASHELRTPLTPIKMQNEVIRRLVEKIPKGALPNRDALLTAVQRSRDRLEGLERLFENLLDVSSIGAGRLVLNREELDLSELVRKTLEGYGTAFKTAGCELVLRGDAPAKGYWDRVRIEQAVVNLISNAMKYGAGKPIEVSVSAGDGSAVLVVRDHGIGIAKDDQSKIGLRFERAASVRHYGGLGLGLYIAREIVLAHAGTMRVESDLGQGAAFIVELPSL
jgi:predicted ATPase/signal transduction histidine kinase